MRLRVEELEQRGLDELRQLFLSIPATQQQLTFYGYFKSSIADYLREPTVAKALAYLPKHLSSVCFQLSYLYSEHQRQITTGEQWTPMGTTYIQRTQHYTQKELGRQLHQYLKALPVTVNKVSITCFNERYCFDSSVDADLVYSLNALPAHVHSLALDEGLTDRHHQQFNQVFAAIPKTVQRLALINTYMNRSSSSLHSSLTFLSIRHRFFSQYSEEFLVSLIERLPQSLTLLDLNDCQLKDIHFRSLELMIQKLNRLPHLTTLRLGNNRLADLGLFDWTCLIKIVPNTVTELDLGNNGLLRLGRSVYQTYMDVFPSRMRSLRFIDTVHQLNVAELKARLRGVPEMLDTLRFTLEGLLSLSLPQMSEVIASLFPHIKHLDFSYNRLSSYPINEVAAFLAHLPQHINTLSLKGNQLALCNTQDLGRILSSIPAHIKTCDLSYNGLGRLPYAQRQEVWHALPTTVQRFVVDSDEFQVRPDGTLVPHLGNPSKPLFFTPQPAQNNVYLGVLVTAVNQLLLEPVTDSNGLLALLAQPDAFCSPMSLVKQQISTYTLPEKPPQLITATVEEECLQLVAIRINALKPTDTSLNLSRCGLNRLENKSARDAFFSQLGSLDRRIETLFLSGNGFLFDKETSLAFVELIGNIPENIIKINLSNNHFESFTAEQLPLLFKSFAATITHVTFDHQPPRPLIEHLEQRRWPASYTQLTADSSEPIEKIQHLLLDYTKNDSAFWRFAYGHWNRSHTNEVAPVTYQISRGQLNQVEDIQEALADVTLKNPHGSLAKRIGFFAFDQATSQNAVTEIEEYKNPIELRALTY